MVPALLEHALDPEARGGFWIEIWIETKTGMG